MGDSGCHVYSTNGTKHHSIVSDLREQCGYPNAHDLTEVGAHPLRQLEYCAIGSTGTCCTGLLSRVRLAKVRSSGATS